MLQLSIEVRPILLLLALLLVPATAPSAGEAEEPAPAPSCTLPRLTGEGSLDLATLAGQVVWVDFWASWCSSCRDALAFLGDLDAELSGRGLAVVGVNLDEQRADALRFLESVPGSFTQLADPAGECPRAFAVRAMPASYLIDRRGRIRFVQDGFRGSDAAALRARVDALLGEPRAAE